MNYRTGSKVKGIMDKGWEAAFNPQAVVLVVSAQELRQEFGGMLETATPGRMA